MRSSSRLVSAAGFQRILRQTPAGDEVYVDGDLSLSGSLALDCLPDRLRVRGWLGLRGCIALRTLPEQLSVGSWIDLRLTQVCAIPRDAVIGSHKLRLSSSQVVIVPDGTWTVLKNCGEVVNGGRLDMVVYDLLAKNPELGACVTEDEEMCSRVRNGTLTLRCVMRLWKLRCTRL